MTPEEAVKELKSMRIRYESEQDSQGLWHSWPEFAPGLWGEGRTQEESIDDMIDMWRRGLEIIAQDRMKPAPEDMPFYAKVLLSTDEELIECLNGEICAVS